MADPPGKTPVRRIILPLWRIFVNATEVLLGPQEIRDAPRDTAIAVRAFGDSGRLRGPVNDLPVRPL
ncbi:MAG TPA: hypothetical protein VM223_05135, partial [Planctomycetota bacterium]|nr:hypothetical protein [Planctomycetota bacterium]